MIPIDYESILFDFAKDKNKIGDFYSYSKAIMAIQQLAQQKANIQLTLLSSTFCFICQDNITKNQYKLNETKKSNCSCNRHYHKKCLLEQIDNIKNEFTDFQSMLDVLNNKYKCKYYCKQSFFNEKSIIEAADMDYYKILINQYHYAKEEKEYQAKINELEKQKNIEFSCGICWDDIDFKTNGYQLECKHQFCKECLKENFKGQIRDNLKIEIDNMKCPQDKCNQKASFHDIATILHDQKDVIEKLEYKNIKTMYERLTRENPDSLEQLVECPGLYCKEEGSDNMIYIPQDNITKYKQTQNRNDLKIKENQKIEYCGYTYIQDRSEKTKIRNKCIKCKYEFCLNRCDDIHIGYTCQQYQQWKMDNNKDYKKELEAQGFKFCPSCSIISIKISGCNRITCDNCKKSYCYLCYFLANTAQEVYAHLQKSHGGYY